MTIATMATKAAMGTAKRRMRGSAAIAPRLPPEGDEAHGGGGGERRRGDQEGGDAEPGPAREAGPGDRQERGEQVDERRGGGESDEAVPGPRRDRADDEERAEREQQEAVEEGPLVHLLPERHRAEPLSRPGLEEAREPVGRERAVGGPRGHPAHEEEEGEGEEAAHRRPGPVEHGRIGLDEEPHGTLRCCFATCSAWSSQRDCSATPRAERVEPEMGARSSPTASRSETPLPANWASQRSDGLYSGGSRNETTAMRRMRPSGSKATRSVSRLVRTTWDCTTAWPRTSAP